MCFTKDLGGSVLYAFDDLIDPTHDIIGQFFLDLHGFHGFLNLETRLAPVMTVLTLGFSKARRETSGHRHTQVIGHFLPVRG